MDFVGILRSAQQDMMEGADRQDSRPWFADQLGFESVEEMLSAVRSLELVAKLSMIQGQHDEMIATILLVGARMNENKRLKQQTGGD